MRTCARLRNHTGATNNSLVKNKMRLRKRTLWVFLVLPLIINIFMIDKVAASPIMVYVDPPRILDLTMVPGTRFTINITVDYVENLWLWQFDLFYNASVLKGISIEVGPFIGSAGGTVMPLPGLGFNNTEGKLALTGALLLEQDPELCPDGGGVLASVTFEVVSLGGSDITLGPLTGLLDAYGNWVVGGLKFDEEKGEWVIVEPLGTYPTDPKFLPRPPHGYFDNRPQVYVDPPKVLGIEIGENFTINVDVADIEDLYRWSFFMRWNASLLNVTSVVEGEFLKREGRETIFTWQSNNTAGYLNVDCTIVGDYDGVGGNGTLVNITFIVKGEGNTILSFYEASFLDSLGQEIFVGTKIGEGWFNNVKFHNVAVKSVTPYPTEVEVGSGDIISIDVTVVNTGSFNERNLIVSAYYDENVIGESETIDFLDKGANVTLTFTWDTTGIKMGFYTVKANVTLVEEEADVEDNTFTYGTVTISGHNIAIASATIPVNLLYKGTNLTITVLMKNDGTFAETFNVTAYYDSVPIETKTVESLHGQGSRKLEFVWDAGEVAEDTYTISVNASVVEGEEDIADNSCIAGTVEVLELVEPFPTELFAVSVAAVAVIGVTVVVFIKRRKPEKAWEEAVLTSSG